MTLIGTAVQSVFTESSEDFAHMGLVLFRVIGINENVIKVMVTLMSRRSLKMSFINL